MIKHIRCNVLDSYAAIIAHQVNCMGVMGSGVAAQVKERFPDAYKAYRAFCDQNRDQRIAMLGTTQFCAVSRYPDSGLPRVYLANLFAQYDYGRDRSRVYTDYAALRQCFVKLSDFALPSDRIIALPSRIGCGYGGGDWEGVVLPMIEEVFLKNRVLVCEYQRR